MTAASARSPVQELGHLPYRNGKTFEDYIGAAGLKRLGKKKWQRKVADVVERLAAALQPEYIVLGGGNAEKIERLPRRTRRGRNNDAFVGGFKLWGKCPISGVRTKAARALQKFGSP